MSRRLSVSAVALLALGASGLIPLALAASSGATCPSWTDPKDAAMTAPTAGAGDFVGTGDPRDPSGRTGDPDVDIVASAITSDATQLTAVIKLDKLSATPLRGLADEFDVYFDLGGKTINAYAIRDAVQGDSTTLADANGSVNRATYPVAVTYDSVASTVTLTAKTSDIEKITGKPVAGLPITNVNTDTFDPNTLSNFDVSDAPKGMAYSYGSGCTVVLPTTGGSPTPTPTTSATPSATPSPSPKPSPTSSPTPTPTGTPGADPMKDFPIAGCSTVTDPKGDGKTAGNGSNDPDLDITALTLRTTATELLAYVNVDKLTAGTATADGQRYAVDFTFNKHLFTMSASSSAHGSTALRDAAAASGLVGHVVQLGVDAPSTTAVPPPTDRGLKASGLKATYDLTNSRVVFSLPIADIVKYGGAAFAGPLTAVDAKSQVETNILSLAADTAGGTTTWTVGDNKCFTQKTALKLSVIKKGVSRTVTAVLSAGGKGLAKQVLTVAVNGKKVGTITTDATGKASYTKAKPNQTVTISFAGVPGFSASTASTKV